MKWLAILAIALAAGTANGKAQENKPLSESDLLKQIDSLGAPPSETQPTPGAKKTPGGKAAKKPVGSPDETQKGPTEITCTKEATFDNKAHQAVFVGSVHVKDPQFTITCEKLTAILRDTAAGKAAVPAPSPGKSTAAGKADSSQAGGLERAVAEGKVVITQDKPGEDGGPAKHSVGKADRADYDAATGDVKLTGWPQIQQGINTQVATDGSTVMYLNREGRMRAEGPTKTILQESAD